MFALGRPWASVALQHANSWHAALASTQLLGAAGTGVYHISSSFAGADKQESDIGKVAITPPCRVWRTSPCLKSTVARTRAGAAAQWESTIGWQQVQQAVQPTGWLPSFTRVQASGYSTDSQRSSDSQAEPTASQTRSRNADPLWTLPNMISMARAVSGPFISYLIIDHNYTWALGATVISGASDWADGALARRLGQHSVLGSYLDPLADKVLVGCVVGALGWEGLVPGWLAALVVGRDVALVAGAVLGRWHALGWRVRGMTGEQFFSTVAVAPATGGEGRTAVASAPAMRPLMISKLNTVLQLGLVVGCLGSSVASWPDADVLHVLEVTTAATTCASFGAYAVRAASGRMHG
mmetsp:Transcript_4001/g.9951  ORF Transcript_4001/g.9951 Transcript_4001/m.9951 type:complete len:353 (-) Transcript_4001:79-1137(-)